jgi:hypothetical protein
MLFGYVLWPKVLKSYQRYDLVGAPLLSFLVSSFDQQSDIKLERNARPAELRCAHQKVVTYVTRPG